MSSLSISVGTSGSQAGHASMSRSLICPRRGFLAVDLLRNSFKVSDGVWPKGLERPNGRSVHKLRVFAKLRKGMKNFDPWYKDIDPNLKSGHLTYLSDFKPLKEKPKPVILEFEKPLLDLEKKINDVRKMADETGLDFSVQISSLERKYQQALKDLYTHLTPYQRLSLARHPNRPTFLDHVLNMTEKWVELHGDRGGYDDPAIVTGLGSMDGRTYMFIGHQKGRDTKENIKRNFGMPTPHGYRKAKRLMEYADHHGFPIITFVDTAGAYADLKSEELGQGEAIANNLRTMFGLKVPIITVVIGEGGSGGALAIACGNKLLMLENAVFFVASPEASAAILWKSAKFAPRAAARMRITAAEHYKLKIADAVIPEPLGGAHHDPSWTSQQIKLAIMKAMDELAPMDAEELLLQRHKKFRIIGDVGSKKRVPVKYMKKLKMKPSGKIVRTRPSDKKDRMKPSGVGAHQSTSPVSPPTPPVSPPKVAARSSTSSVSPVKVAKVVAHSSISPVSPRKVAAHPSISPVSPRKVAARHSISPVSPRKVAARPLTSPLSPRKVAARPSNPPVSPHKVAARPITSPVSPHKVAKVAARQSTRPVSLPKVAARPSTLRVSTRADLKSLKKKTQQAKGQSLRPVEVTKKLSPVTPTMAIKKLRQEINQELANAFISMGLQEKFQSLKLEFSKTSANPPDQPCNPELREKVDELRQEFENRLSEPGAYLHIKKKLAALNSLDRVRQKAGSEKLKKELNEKLDNEVKQKVDILKMTRERVEKGELLDEDQKAEIKLAKEELQKALETANLKVVGVGKKAASMPPDLAVKIAKINKAIGEEIEQAVDSAGLRTKIEELKGEIRRGSSQERITKLEEEIKEGIVAVMDLPALKEKIDGGLTAEVSTTPPLEAVGLDGNVVADNGRA